MGVRRGERGVITCGAEKTPHEVFLRSSAGTLITLRPSALQHVAPQHQHQLSEGKRRLSDRKLPVWKPNEDKRGFVWGGLQNDRLIHVFCSPVNLKEKRKFPTMELKPSRAEKLNFWASIEYFDYLTAVMFCLKKVDAFVFHLRPFSSTMLSSSRHWLLLLLFLPRSLGCQTSSFTECQHLPFVPGHNLAGEGFDVVTMKMTGASAIDVKTFMVGGVQGNCTVCRNQLLNQVRVAPVRTVIKPTSADQKTAFKHFVM